MLKKTSRFRRRAGDWGEKGGGMRWRRGEKGGGVRGRGRRGEREEVVWEAG